MRQYAHLLHGLDEVPRVVALDCTQRGRCPFFMRLAHSVDHRFCSFALSVAVSVRARGIDHDSPTNQRKRML